MTEPAITTTTTGTSSTPQSPHHYPSSLSPFFRSEHIPLLPLLPIPPSVECLTIQDHNLRTSHSSHLNLHLSLSNSLSTHQSESGTSTPTSPSSRDSYSSLYPPPPHLTPQTSPIHSPRSHSPVLGQSASLSPDDHLLHHHPSTHLLGKLTITVVEAKGLAITTGSEKPYVLLQYDRTDSVSREFGAVAPSSLPKKSNLEGGGKKKIGQMALARAAARPGLRQTQSSMGVLQVNKNTVTTVRRVGDEKEKGKEKEVPTAAGEREKEAEIALGSPGEPVWNHVAQFDVVQTSRTILLCVYDKLAPIGGFPAHGFLGATVFEPPLETDTGVDGKGLDVWLPLTSALDPTLGGEVRLRILFEKLHTRPKLTVDDFQVLRLIGSGSFGQVFKVRKRDTKRIYAMKVIGKESVASRAALNQVLAERQVLARTLDSPFLIGLKFSFQNSQDLFFVMDYKGGGELFTHLQKDGGRFEESKVRFYLCEIILALEYLHTHGIIYRDLKPENCLLDGSGHCVLVDFGLSKLLPSSEDSTRTLCGTTAFMAPEILMDVGYNFRCDWWSLGCLLYEMCYGWSPFYAETRVEEYERILTGEIKIPSKKGYSGESKDLLLKLLTREPSQRLGTHGAIEIQSHPFFTNVSWQKVALRQLSPPYKPPTAADDDDYYCEHGRSGEWMFGQGFSSEREWKSQRASMTDAEDLDAEGLFRDFSFSKKGVA